ncbi:MAG TPA: hypothetical protein VH478_23930 [Trebonia sp.]|nr:hypothetical protein [Trebonia sp.]
MLVTNRVLSGALIGAAARRPAVALALGVASHFALDATPHWSDWHDDRARFMRRCRTWTSQRSPSSAARCSRGR